MTDKVDKTPLNFTPKEPDSIESQVVKHSGRVFSEIVDTETAEKAHITADQMLKQFIKESPELELNVIVNVGADLPGAEKTREEALETLMTTVNSEDDDDWEVDDGSEIEFSEEDTIKISEIEVVKESFRAGDTLFGIKDTNTKQPFAFQINSEIELRDCETIINFTAVKAFCKDEESFQNLIEALKNNEVHFHEGMSKETIETFLQKIENMEIHIIGEENWSEFISSINIILTSQKVQNSSQVQKIETKEDIKELKIPIINEQKHTVNQLRFGNIYHSDFPSIILSRNLVQQEILNSIKRLQDLVYEQKEERKQEEYEKKMRVIREETIRLQEGRYIMQNQMRKRDRIYYDNAPSIYRYLLKKSRKARILGALAAWA